MQSSLDKFNPDSIKQICKDLFGIESHLEDFFFEIIDNFDQTKLCYYNKKLNKLLSECEENKEKTRIALKGCYVLLHLIHMLTNDPYKFIPSIGEFTSHFPDLVGARDDLPALFDYYNTLVAAKEVFKIFAPKQIRKELFMKICPLIAEYKKDGVTYKPCKLGSGTKKAQLCGEGRTSATLRREVLFYLVCEKEVQPWSVSKRAGISPEDGVACADTINGHVENLKISSQKYIDKINSDNKVVRVDDTPARSNKRSSSETTDDSISSKHPRLEIDEQATMCAGGNAPVVDGDLDSFSIFDLIDDCGNGVPYVDRQSNIQCKHKC